MVVPWLLCQKVSGSTLEFLHFNSDISEPVVLQFLLFVPTVLHVVSFF